MKRRLVLFAFAFCLWQSVNAESINFDHLKAGSPLKGWLSGFYGAKGNPNWLIAEDSSANSGSKVLKQNGVAVYSWLVKASPVIDNGIIEADVQITEGKEDPEAGLVFRHLDGKNYYYVRVNAIKDNVVFYRMNNGIKETVKIADTKVSFKKWNRIKVEFQNDQIDIHFNGKPLISARDSVIKKPGHVGFFTTADTISLFDNFSYQMNH